MKERERESIGEVDRDVFSPAETSGRPVNAYVAAPLAADAQEQLRIAPPKKTEKQRGLPQHLPIIWQREARPGSRIRADPAVGLDPDGTERERERDEAR